MTAAPCQVCGGLAFAFRFTKGAHRFVRCRDCGLERIEPQPGDAELAAIYGRHYYDAWGLDAGVETARAVKLATFRRRLAGLALPRGARVLDCGAATGLAMEAAAERGLEPYGVELSDFGAQEIARRFGPGRVFRGRLEDARFGGLELGGFAAVLMYDFLEHVRDPVAVLGKARVLLAPGGILSICTPSTGSFSRRLSGRAWPHYHVEHLFYFGAENLATLLRRSGFDELRRERAWKWLSLRYVGCQLEAHPNRPLGALARALLRVLPATLADRPLPVLAGELLLHARRRDGQEDPR